MERVERAGLAVDAILAEFVEGRALPGTGVPADAFWAGLSDLIHGLGPRNRALLETRGRLQGQIDDWHLAQAGAPFDAEDYEAFLREIGYLGPEGPASTTETPPTDPEIAILAGPQLVVPVTNARFALNAANARWVSLFDALYGTDALGTPPPRGAYEPARGAEVVAWVKGHLDAVAPLVGASWAEVTGARAEAGQLVVPTPGGEVVRAFVPRRWAAHSAHPARASLSSTSSSDQTTPKASIASATRVNPAMFAPAA